MAIQSIQGMKYVNSKKIIMLEHASLRRNSKINKLFPRQLIVYD